MLTSKQTERQNNPARLSCSGEQPQADPGASWSYTYPSTCITMEAHRFTQNVDFVISWPPCFILAMETVYSGGRWGDHTVTRRSDDLHQNRLPAAFLLFFYIILTEPLWNQNTCTPSDLTFNITGDSRGWRGTFQSERHLFIGLLSK